MTCLETENCSQRILRLRIVLLASKELSRHLSRFELALPDTFAPAQRVLIGRIIRPELRGFGRSWFVVFRGIAGNRRRASSAFP